MPPPQTRVFPCSDGADRNGGHGVRSRRTLPQPRSQRCCCSGLAATACTRWSFPRPCFCRKKKKKREKNCLIVYGNYECCVVWQCKWAISNIFPTLLKRDRIYITDWGLALMQMQTSLKSPGFCCYFSIFILNDIIMSLQIPGSKQRAWT